MTMPEVYRSHEVYGGLLPEGYVKVLAGVELQFQRVLVDFNRARLEAGESPIVTPTIERHSNRGISQPMATSMDVLKKWHEGGEKTEELPAAVNADRQIRLSHSSISFHFPKLRWGEFNREVSVTLIEPEAGSQNLLEVSAKASHYIAEPSEIDKIYQEKGGIHFPPDSDEETREKIRTDGFKALEGALEEARKKPGSDRRKGEEYYKKEIVGRFPSESDEEVVDQALTDALTKVFGWSEQDLT